MDDYFTITQTHYQQQELAYLVLCMESEVLEWWRGSKHRYTTWKEVKYAIREYYGNHYKPDCTFNKISDLKQTATVQKYLNDINRLNVHAKIHD